MEKPISVIIDEFKRSVAKSVSDAGIHIEVIAMAMNEMNNEVRNIANQQALKEKTEYEKSITETNDGKGNDAIVDDK